MNKIVIGKYVNTHGVKGEIRIKSSFKYKDRVFKIGGVIIIDKPYTIKSYRVHKEFDMVTLEGIDSINDIAFFKNSLVYIDKDLYMNDVDYLDSDLMGFAVFCNNKLIGEVHDVLYISDNKKLLRVDTKLIPWEFILDIDLSLRKIVVNYVEGLL